MRNTLFLVLCLFLAGFSAQAQKFGYVNSQAVLADMPEVKAAESDLMSYREQQQKLLESKIKSAQADYQALVEKQQAGELTPKQLQDGEARLQKKQEELAQLEAQIQQQLAQRRDEKFQPIFDKVNNAIKEVAEAEQYIYVFDAATGGVIVYADESMDITDKVRAKLGM